MNDLVIRVGTRGSSLALRQATEVVTSLSDFHNLTSSNFEIIEISTRGDVVLDRPISEIGGKGIFSSELESALTDGRIDIAVHSAKDMSSVLPFGLEIGCYLPRIDVRDAFLCSASPTLDDLPTGATIGTSSVRRRSLLLRRRPDLKIKLLRGNVTTRLSKLDAGEFDATILASAGLIRLGLADRITSYLDISDFLPSPGQGALALEVRSSDTQTLSLVSDIDDSPTRLCLEAERSFLRTIEGSCRLPVCGYANYVEGSVELLASVLSLDGSEVYNFEGSCEGSIESCVLLGVSAGESLRSMAGSDFFSNWDDSVSK